MTARGRLLSCLVTVVMALAGFVTAGALPAAAAPSAIQYVALGDSYAAGTAIQPCTQSGIGYPALIDLESRIEFTKNAACSGATTETVVLPPELNSETRLVTLTVGAANLGLSDVAVACLAGTLPDCLKAIGTAQRELGDCPGGESPLGGQLITLYGKVAEKAPNARIVVTGYPLLFEPPADTDDSELAAKIRAINEATTTLNCVIERAVTAAKDEVNIHYVDVTKVFEKHSIGCTNSCTLFIYPAGPEAFHPTEAGYKAYADAIKTKLPNGWLDKPSP